jgi:hypothetical protein
MFRVLTDSQIRVPTRSSGRSAIFGSFPSSLDLSTSPLFPDVQIPFRFGYVIISGVLAHNSARKF